METSRIRSVRFWRGTGEREILFVEHEQEEAGEEEVHDEDEYGRNDDGGGGGAPHALRTALHAESLVAADSGDNQAEDNWFCAALNEIAQFQGLDGARPKLDSAEPQREVGHDKSADEPHKIKHGYKEGQHRERGKNTRSHQLADRIGAQRAHRVHLLGDNHRAEFGSDTRRVAAGHQQRRNGGSKFANQRARY